ncbi:MAG: hypothetical protein ACJ786_12150 [Catenulispora sp.]
MHNLGQSNMEHSMSGNGQEYGSPLQEGPNYEGYGYESPLQEILQSEAPLQEQGDYEGPGYEAPYQETYGEQPYGEYQETSGEQPFGEYQEASGEQPFGEYQEGPYGESSGLGESGLAGEDELALTSELLGVQSQEEMDQFLGKLFRRVSRGVQGFFKSPLGRMLGGVLSKLAKAALPLAGKALGSVVGGPVGGMVGGQVGSMGAQAMGLELQEMSPPEADFAAARQFVRFATDMIRRAEQGQPNLPPAAVVRQAVQGAAQRWAPGFLSPQLPRLRVDPAPGGRRGTWVRRGRTITLYGV